MTPQRWRDLAPDHAIVAALEFAGAETSREEIRADVERIQAPPTETARKREGAVLLDIRKRWSERFANSRATVVAVEIRRHTATSRRYEVLPDEHGLGQETFTPLGDNKGKRIALVVAGPLGVYRSGSRRRDSTSPHIKNGGSPVSLPTAPPAPVDHEYDRMIARIASEYDVRFRNV